MVGTPSQTFGLDKVETEELHTTKLTHLHINKNPVVCCNHKPESKSGEHEQMFDFKQNIWSLIKHQYIERSDHVDEVTDEAADVSDSDKVVNVLYNSSKLLVTTANLSKTATEASPRVDYLAELFR